MKNRVNKTGPLSGTKPGDPAVDLTRCSLLPLGQLFHDTLDMLLIGLRGLLLWRPNARRCSITTAA